ncbi:MAG: hypothetical protein ACLGIO_03455 [Acidimicrobiia bacterium]
MASGSPNWKKRPRLSGALRNTRAEAASVTASNTAVTAVRATMATTDIGTSTAAVRTMRPTSPRTRPWTTAASRNSTSRAAANSTTAWVISRARGPANQPWSRLTVDEESR